MNWLNVLLILIAMAGYGSSILIKNKKSNLYYAMYVLMCVPMAVLPWQYTAVVIINTVLPVVRLKWDDPVLKRIHESSDVVIVFMLLYALGQSCGFWNY